MRKHVPEWQASRLVHSSLKIKIVPPTGASVWRFEFKRQHLRLTAFLAAISMSGVALYSYSIVHRTSMSIDTMRHATLQQQARLRSLDEQAAELDVQLRQIKAQNRELRGLIGMPEKRHADAPRPHASNARPPILANLEMRLSTLRTQAAYAAGDQERLRSVALRVLNMRHLEAISRARVLASIPSIRPVDYEEVASTFGWRTNPWPEFHKGLDLDAEVGTPVRSTAAGTVTFAGWDGGFGQKVEIDHHNGFTTWYCHLSRIDVSAGEQVTKGRLIAAVGATGEATGPHLHYQLMKAGQAIDPMPFLDGIPKSEIASLK